MKIKSIIVDDERHAISVLSSMLNEFCNNDIDIIGSANSVANGKEVIRTLKPELVFLDINMIDGYGFEVLNEKYEHPFEVIFTTAYSEFAIKAFDHAALHYLLKPVDPDQLIEAVERFKQRNKPDQAVQIELLKESLENRLERIVLPDAQGFAVYPIDDITRFESTDGYTFAHVENKPKILLSNSLTYYEELLENNHFCRIHAKHLLNLAKVDKYVSQGRAGFALLNNGEKIDVSVRKKDDFLEQLKNLSIL